MNGWTDRQFDGFNIKSSARVNIKFRLMLTVFLYESIPILPMTDDVMLPGFYQCRAAHQHVRLPSKLLLTSTITSTCNHCTSPMMYQPDATMSLWSVNPPIIRCYFQPAGCINSSPFQETFDICEAASALVCLGVCTLGPGRMIRTQRSVKSHKMSSWNVIFHSSLSKHAGCAARPSGWT